MVTENITNNGPVHTAPLGDLYARLYPGRLCPDFARPVDTKVVQEHGLLQCAEVLRLHRRNVDDQYVGQQTSISSSTTTMDSGNVLTNNKQFSWPLSLSYAYSANADGSYQQFSALHQGFNRSELMKLNGTTVYSSTFSDSVAPTDTLQVNAQGVATPVGQANSETYKYSNSNGACWNQTIQAANGVLTSVQGGSCMRR